MPLPSLLTLINDSRFLDHDTGGDHPEIPARIQSILATLEQSDCFALLEQFGSRPAERQWLMAAHDEGWLFRFEEAVLSGKTFIDHPDNQIGYDSYDVATLAAGAGLTAIDLLEQQQAQQCFALVRPPGHHAERIRPFGFCFFNNCVVAARYWQQHYGRKRVVVFDFDAHHGNGIQSAFEREEDSLYISIHEHPSFSYPGTGYADEKGFAAGRGSILNLPLSPGAGDAQILALLPAVEEKIAQWQPDAMIVAAGFDGHRADEMSGLLYSTGMFEKIGESVRSWSNLYCHGRLLSILEGGYEMTVLGESVEAYVQGLLAR
ncbi:MAG: histone deacetylase [Proteobacteria bacterium]|jgi:acetoin utilization deacetylase AcuC-like enzyme|nr:histone deacetylase [Desulfocapsa sp.]MBU3946180.1 histone deacetylase [Pseudomonadota bacterium]MBU4027803.1 histone deacetylase [Pseudomonadota bacterium]MBU4043698.1 histone deacetylase [Pseudomonadota bacterium]MBU4085416.1 histone deacetylase [Pseudomonadota bacterium]